MLRTSIPYGTIFPLLLVALIYNFGLYKVSRNSDGRRGLNASPELQSSTSKQPNIHRRLDGADSFTKVWNTSAWRASKAKRTSSSKRPLADYQISCFNMKDSCIDYNNRIVVFDFSYETTGVIPGHFLSDSYFGNDVVQNLRLWFPSGSSSDILQNGVHLAVKLRLATDYENREHLKEFRKLMKLKRNGLAKPENVTKRGIVYVQDWIENFGHSMYGAARFLSAYDDGSLSDVFGEES